MTGPDSPSIRVLVVEDDPVAAEAHRTYVDRVPGFAVVGVAYTGTEAARMIQQQEIDLLLLDFYLPDGHGLQVVRAVRAAGHLMDVIAVTSARDLAMVRSAISEGVVQYLLKPFTFATLQDRLVQYAKALERRAEDDAADESGVDGVVAGTLPKGMSADTLNAVLDALRSATGGLSAASVAAEVGLSRATARRYLEYLAESGTAVRRPQYGQVGRPELVYTVH
ncbi:response regulator [Lentzea sp. NPDC059081]|uniref:response regulator n=1 Tax=Lentzea sp. NPDC059081 TaxID=3346719 RepID=UPI0036ACB3A7